MQQFFVSIFGVRTGLRHSAYVLRGYGFFSQSFGNPEGSLIDASAQANRHVYVQQYDDTLLLMHPGDQYG